jgi:hypothetical protein
MSLEEFKSSVILVKRKPTKENVIRFLRSLSTVMPSGEDYAITVGSVGGYSYMIDSKGAIMVSVTQDEYLPFFSAKPKHIRFEEIPERVLNSVPGNLRGILDQLRDLILDWNRTGRGEYRKKSEEILNFIIETI